MRTYPVTAEIEIAVEEKTKRRLKYIVRVEADSRREAREKAREEFIDFMNEKKRNTSVNIDYRLVSMTLQDDPYIYRADRPPKAETISSRPNVMGVPNN